MEVKEIIQSLEKYRDSLYPIHAIQIKNLNITQINEVINLLQKGEKFERMWEKIREKVQSGWINYIEKEYFPLIKKTITIESKSEEDMEKIINLFKSDAKCFDVKFEEDEEDEENPEDIPDDEKNFYRKGGYER